MVKIFLRELKHIGASVAAASIFVGVLFSPVASQASDEATGSSLTSSAKTVAAVDYELDYAHSPMPDLKVTVSQTKDLTSQGIVISWTGGKVSRRPSSTGGENFLQIFQCWGEDANHPGHPDRTTCQYGGVGGEGSARDNNTQADQVDPQDVKYTMPGSGWASPPMTAIPFNSVTGEQVWTLKRSANGTLTKNDVSSGSNQFFSAQTTNEITWAGSEAGGSGQAKFEVQTASQSPGLGCGNPQKLKGKYIGQPCWIVALPRGTADNRQSGISQSGLFWDAWKHHIAFKVGFKPIGVKCQIGVPELQVQGSEILGEAFSSWQPSLCGGSVNTAFVVSNQFDGDALISASGDAPSPLAITTHALNEEANDPLVYAPLTVSGISLSFAIDRSYNQSIPVPADVIARDQTPFESMKLNPRLIAKLLTASYIEALPRFADLAYMGGNPRNLTKDPEFLAVNAENPDWQYMDLKGPGLADALMPNSRSFLAERIWSYILADQDAREFMAGKADQYGMKVNPWYCTDPKVNPTGSGFSMPNLGFPKSDPVEKPDNSQLGVAGSGAINLVTWRPYISDFESGAANALRGNAQELGAWNNAALPPSFGKPTRAPAGAQKVIAITTLPAAEKFQTVSVSLLNSAGRYVAPNMPSLTAGLKAMTPSKLNKNVYEYDFSSDSAKASEWAYPLTVVAYAAINPLQTGIEHRSAFANMIRFAAKNGQNPGTDAGQLPPGYAPLSKEFVARAIAAATAIEEGISPLKTVENGESGVQPSPEPTTEPQIIIAAGETPADPKAPISAASMPVVFSLFLCSLMFYALIRKRKALV
jgi:hypothetical protein